LPALPLISLQLSRSTILAVALHFLTGLAFAIVEILPTLVVEANGIRLDSFVVVI
jgi:hypothetical protein